jgi:hypothetical protein
MDELAEMLAAGGKFDIRAEIITDKDVVSYYEEMKREIDTLNNLKVNKLQTIINNVKYNTSALLYDISKEETADRYIGMLKAVTDSAGSNELKTVIDSLKNFTVSPSNEHEWKTKLEELQNSIDMTYEHSEALAINLYRLRHTTVKMVNHLKELAKNVNNKSDLNTISVYDKHIDYFLNFLGNTANPDSAISIFNEAIKNDTTGTLNSDNPVYELVSNITSTLKQGKTVIHDINFKATENLAKMILEPMLDWTNRYYDDLISKLEAKGATSEVLKMKKEKVAMTRPLTNLEDNLKGYLGEGSLANFFIEGFLYSQDPIVASLAKYITDNYIDVVTISQRKSNSFIKAIYPLAEEAGISHVDLGSSGEVLGFKDRVHVAKNDEEDPEPLEVWSILNDFQDTRFYISQYQNRIKKARKIAEKDNNYTKVIEIEIEMQDHITKYFHRKFKPQFYKRFELFRGKAGTEALIRLKNWQR